MLVGHHTFPPVNRCIYCGARDKPLAKEHIIPFALGGNLVLPKASCSDCARVTMKFEQTCARTMFGPMRIRMGMQTRNKRERPSTIETIVAKPGGVIEKFRVPAMKFPAMCIGAQLPSPEILTKSRSGPGRAVLFSFDGELESFTRNITGNMMVGKLPLQPLYKLIAKIAHAYAVSQVGVDSFSHFMPDLILGRSTRYRHYIGGDADYKVERVARLHTLACRKIEGTRLLFVTITLFAFAGLPRYHAVVGEDLRN